MSKSESAEPVAGLAAALQAAKLKKTNGVKTSSGQENGASSGQGTVGRSSGGGMASMMDEMQKTLARRRAKVDRSSEEPDSDRQDGGEGRRQEIEKSSSPGKPFSQPGSQAGSESPRPEMMNGSSSELEAMKQEILKEMRKEIAKAKLEIIEVIRQEMSRR